MTDNETRENPENAACRTCAATRIAAAIVIGRKIIIRDWNVTNFSSRGGVRIGHRDVRDLRDQEREKFPEGDCSDVTRDLTRAIVQPVARRPKLCSVKNPAVHAGLGSHRARLQTHFPHPLR
jgi:hypothetical protein